MIELLNRLRRKERRILTALGILLAAAVLFLALVANPRRGSYLRSLGELESVQAKRDRLSDSRTEKQGDWDRWQQAIRDIQEIRAERFYKADLVLREMRGDLSRLFRTNGFPDSRIKYDYVSMHGGMLRKLTASFEIEGPYERIKRFLAAAEESAKFLVVERIEFTKIDSGSGSLALNVVLAGYYE